MYCILRLRKHGNISWFVTDEERQAFAYYWWACFFNRYQDSFIALFRGHTLIEHNQDGKIRN
jgi:hypothetical protein